MVILPGFIKSQHFKHHGKRLYKENIVRTFIFNEMSKLQYNVLIGCLTIQHKISVITGKLRMFIFIVMEREELYSNPQSNFMHVTAQNKFSRVVSLFVKFGKIYLHLGKITRYTVYGIFAWFMHVESSTHKLSIPHRTLMPLITSLQLS